MPNKNFKITKEDIENVLESYQVNLSKEQLNEASDMVDDDEVNKAVSSTDIVSNNREDIQEAKKEAAYDSIAQLLYQEGYIPKENVELYGNTFILGNK